MHCPHQLIEMLSTLVSFTKIGMDLIHTLREIPVLRVLQMRAARRGFTRRWLIIIRTVLMMRVGWQKFFLPPIFRGMMSSTYLAIWELQILR